MTEQPFPVIKTQGHGLPDHCSEHGDIPGNMSIAGHIEAEHGMTYEQFRTLEEARLIQARVDLINDLQEAVTQSRFDFARRSELHALVRSLPKDVTDEPEPA